MGNELNTTEYFIGIISVYLVIFMTDINIFMCRNYRCSWFVAPVALQVFVLNRCEINNAVPANVKSQLWLK